MLIPDRPTTLALVLPMDASFEEVIKVLPNAVIIIDESGTIQKINASAEKMFGHKGRDIYGQNVQILMPESYRPLHDQAINNYIKSNNPHVIGTGREAEAVRRDGSSFPILLSIGEFVSKKQRYFIGIIDDLTKNNQLLKDLSLSRERSALAQKFAQIGMWDWTINSGDLYWSERIAPLFGHEQGALKTSYENFVNAIHPEDRERVTEAVNACVEKGEKYDIEHRVVWPDGTVRWLMERGDVIRDIDGKPVRMLGVVQDITDRKELEQGIIKAKEEAETAAHAKSVFLANMSHEIRTPMNAVVGLTDVVLETELTPDQREHLSTVRSSANALLSLINDILDISKLESGKLGLEKTKFHLPRSLKNVLQTFTIAAREKALELNLKIHPDLFHCFIGDPTRLRQILINLVGNAIKFTEKGGITISAEPEKEDMYRFSVADSGIGMTPAQVGKIFEPFIQADQSTARRYGGTGLGTTISKQLVELMDGEIWAESELGEGTTFYFTAHLQKPDCAENCQENCPAHAMPGEIPLPKSKRRFNILLVEDIPANVTLAIIRLEQQGHDVKVTWNGLEAVNAVKEKPFDLILMDVQMPEMDGMEATRQIRAFEGPDKHTPIIAMTASVMHEDLELCRQAGMDEIVPKPVDFAQLFAAMEQLVPPGAGEPITAMQVELDPVQEFTLPKLAGIDTQKGLQTWQDAESYANALIGFVEDYSDSAATLKTIITGQNDHEEGYRLTHALKGVAGNLAISSIANAAENIGLAIKHQDFEKATALLPTLNKAFKTVSKAIKTIKLPNREHRLRKFDPHAVTLIFNDLNEALQEDTPEAVYPLLKKLDKYLSKDKTATLRKLVEDFDFDEAREAASLLARDLDLKPRGKS